MFYLFYCLQSIPIRGRPCHVFGLLLSPCRSEWTGNAMEQYINLMFAVATPVNVPSRYVHISQFVPRISSLFGLTSPTPLLTRSTDSVSVLQTESINESYERWMVFRTFGSNNKREMQSRKQDICNRKISNQPVTSAYNKLFKVNQFLPYVSTRQTVPRRVLRRRISGVLLYSLIDN